jgi:hypothetical protein
MWYLSGTAIDWLAGVVVRGPVTLSEDLRQEFDGFMRVRFAFLSATVGAMILDFT